jgi:hypothetical protein
VHALFAPIVGVESTVVEGAGARSVGEFRRMPDASIDQHVVETMITAGHILFSNSPPPPHMHDIIGRIAPRPVFIIWATHGVDTEALNPEYFKAAGEPKTLGDPRVQARRRTRGPAGGVRAARHRLLRPGVETMSQYSVSGAQR